MPDHDDAPRKNLKITALTPAEISQVLSSAASRRITEEQVREIAERAGIIQADGTISLLDYTASLIEEYAKDA